MISTPPSFQSSISTVEVSPYSLFDEIHARALALARQYKRVEAELVGVIQEVDRHRIYQKRGHSSLFQYVVRELRLSEAQAYMLIHVSRKAMDVPELKASLETGAITLTNARRIVPVLTKTNHEEWLRKAATLSSRQLEKEIVRIRPEEATSEKAKYVTPERVELKVGLTEREMLKLRRVQDLLCQSRRSVVSLEETIEVLTSEFLRRKDPVEKAKRHQVRKGPLSGSASKDVERGGEQTPESRLGEGPSQERNKNLSRAKDQQVARQARRLKRIPISSRILHAVNLRDQRRCAHIQASGERCNQSR